MKVDWSVVRIMHIVEACRLHDQQRDLPSSKARNTFLIVDGKRYPAKHIRGLAYRLATGRTLNPSIDYSGGKDTVRFFNRLGVDVEYEGRLVKGHRLDARMSTGQLEGQKPQADRGRADLQKVALEHLLEQRFGDVVAEKKFDWLVVPDRTEMDTCLAAIVDGLASHRGYTGFYSPGQRLSVDYFIPSQRLIIEYDERQHFTIPRTIALGLYPANLRLGFDIRHWRSVCEMTCATDNSPYDRDETRAFYDSLRDILASQRGIKVVRIRHGEFDWTRPDNEEELAKMLGGVGKDNALTVTARSTRETGQAAVTAEKRRSVRLVTICVGGKPLSSTTDNGARENLLAEAVDAIEQRGWIDLDAILLPGGFFFLDQYVGPLSFRQRTVVLEQASFHEVCKAACQRLTSGSPGVLVVAGVDTERPSRWSNWTWWGDQLCVAWSAVGLVGIGRKVFPTSGETLHYICYENDYGTESRLMVLPCGQKAILCACYDMFGCAESTAEPTARTRNISYFSTGGPPLEADSADRERLVGDFERLLAGHKVKVGLAAIHELAKPGTTHGGIVNWQRHGIAGCSAALGGLSVGAAHFSWRVPEVNSKTLAAADVGIDHLKEGRHRKANQLKPLDGLVTNGGLLVRLFQW